jgi:murein L,D-transpeptidase YcbB/YkuD
LGALVFIASVTFPGFAQPHVPDSGVSGTPQSSAVENPAAGPDEVRPVKAADKKASSTLWRSHLWDGLPSETLSGPDPDLVSEAYQNNDWRPIFIDSQFELTQGAALLLGQLRELENQAIDSRPFKLDELAQSLQKLDQSRSALQSADPELKDNRADSLAAPPQPGTAASNGIKYAGLAPEMINPAELLDKYEQTFRAASETDIRLTTAFFALAREMNPFVGQEECLRAISGEVPISSFLKDLEPKTFNYEALVSAYRRYRELAAQGGQQHVNIASKVQRGESGNHIRELQNRLQQEGFYSAKFTAIYDGETERAVKDFQAAHLIDQDGAVGRQTTQWINVSFGDKERMIAIALKAVRQSPSRVNSRFIRINIPQFMLEYYKDGQFQEAHRIVVGKASGKQVKFRGRMVGENQTPTLTSSIEQIILNPRWYVSDRIRLELNAEAKSDPQWFTKHGYVAMQSQHPWGEPRLFQSPGPKNALGRVKFEFSNPYAVYLHDTPLKQLFARTRRDFSHGCIRVDKAIDLAERLLKDDGNPYAEKMQAIFEGSNQVFVKLAHPVPISIEYIPVVTNGDAQVVFVGDPYGILTENNSQKG